MKSIKITRASEQDKGITIRTSQFDSSLIYNNGDRYYIEIEGLPFAIPMTLSREGTTLYSGKLDPLIAGFLYATVGLPEVGEENAILVNVKLGRQLKTATLSSEINA